MSAQVFVYGPKGTTTLYEHKSPRVYAPVVTRYVLMCKQPQRLPCGLRWPLHARAENAGPRRRHAGGGGQPCAGVCVVCVVSLPPVFWRAHVCAWQGSTGSAAGRKTQDKLQWIVAQRLLSALTTPGFSLSHLQKSYRIQHPKRR